MAPARVPHHLLRFALGAALESRLYGTKITRAISRRHATSAFGGNFGASPFARSYRGRSRRDRRYESWRPPTAQAREKMDWSRFGIGSGGSSDHFRLVVEIPRTNLVEDMKPVTHQKTKTLCITFCFTTWRRTTWSAEPGSGRNIWLWPGKRPLGAS